MVPFLWRTQLWKPRLSRFLRAVNVAVVSHKLDSVGSRARKRLACSHAQWRCAQFRGPHLLGIAPTTSTLHLPWFESFYHFEGNQGSLDPQTVGRGPPSLNSPRAIWHWPMHPAPREALGSLRQVSQRPLFWEWFINRDVLPQALGRDASTVSQPWLLYTRTGSKRTGQHNLIFMQSGSLLSPPRRSRKHASPRD
jgi:hypothetical protein